MSVLLRRRTFLKGLGLGVGASLLGPLVGSALAEGALEGGAGDVPKRVVFVITGNGMYPGPLISPLTQAALAGPRDALVEVPGDLASAPGLSALAGADGALDLTPHSVAIHGLSSKIAGGGHTSLFKALSCSKARQQTIDAWLARRLHTTHPFPALRFGVTESSSAQLQYGLCLDGPGRDMPIIANPVDAHTALFGSIAQGAGQQQFESKAALLDFARGDIRAVQQQFVGNGRERQKLDAYLQAVEELAGQQERLRLAGDDLRALAQNEGLDPDGGDALNSPHPLVRLESQFELATAALLGNLTPVMVITNSAGNAFAHTRYTSLVDMFGVPLNEVPWRHGVCHEAGGNPIYQAVIHRVIERQVELIARMARRLAAVPEGDGTMLDHTLIVFMSDNGDTHHSTAANWPMLLVGGGALGLRTGLAAGGRSLVYPPHGRAANQRVSNLFDTLGHVVGHPTGNFGGEPEKAIHGGPLAALIG